MPWNEDEEKQIDMLAEAKRRAAKKIRDDERKEKQDEDCANGKHAKFVDKKCSNCGADEPAPQPEPKKKSLMWS